MTEARKLKLLEMLSSMFEKGTESMSETAEAVIDYNIMIGTLEDPSEEDE